MPQTAEDRWEELVAAELAKIPESDRARQQKATIRAAKAHPVEHVAYVDEYNRARGCPPLAR